MTPPVGSRSRSSRSVGKPLLAWQVGRLAAAGVDRVIISCAAGQEPHFDDELAGLGVEVVCAAEPERLGRGGGIRFAAQKRRDSGDVIAMNGDELVAADFSALLAAHRANDALATVVVARPQSQFAQVELDRRRRRDRLPRGRPRPLLGQLRHLRPLGRGARLGFPRRATTRRPSFPASSRSGRLRAYRHDGLWLTVNTPKELRRADEHVTAHPEWLA